MNQPKRKIIFYTGEFCLTISMPLLALCFTVFTEYYIQIFPLVFALIVVGCALILTGLLSLGRVQ